MTSSCTNNRPGLDCFRRNSHVDISNDEQRQAMKDKSTDDFGVGRRKDLADSARLARFKMPQVLIAQGSCTGKRHIDYAPSNPMSAS